MPVPGLLTIEAPMGRARSRLLLAAVEVLAARTGGRWLFHCVADACHE
jgi:hypothetical protein